MLMSYQTDGTTQSMEEYKKVVTVPDDFVFRQNEHRTDDLEVEERALMNL